MGVYIKGLKMPKTGRVVISIDAKGKIYSETPGLAFWKYAAVEIPTPHGRLIDANKLADNIATMLERNNKLIDLWLANLIQDEIDDAPTIVEAEGGDAK